MNQFFQDLEARALEWVLGWTGTENGAFLLIDEQGLVVRQSWHAQIIFGDLVQQPFAQVLDPRVAAVVQRCAREHASIQVQAEVEGQIYQLCCAPIDNALLIFAQPQEERAAATTLSLHTEAKFAMQLNKLLRISSQALETDPQMAQELRRMALQMNRELLHASLLREGHNPYGTRKMGSLQKLCEQAAEQIMARCDCLVQVTGQVKPFAYNAQSMQIILYNVLTNAAQAQGVTCITVDLQQLGDEVCIEVTDNGTPPAQTEMQGTLARLYRGMGLDVSRKLLTEQGGILTLEVTPQGACCRMVFTTEQLDDGNELGQIPMDMGVDLPEMMLSIL